MRALFLLSLLFTRLSRLQVESKVRPCQLAGFGHSRSFAGSRPTALSLYAVPPPRRRGAASSQSWPRRVYITGLGTFLPNDPVQNEDIERHIGKINGVTGKIGKIILRNNKIKTRYYAMVDEVETHVGGDLAAAAVKDSVENAGASIDLLTMLTTGTSMPDQLIPGDANMVHAKLGMKHSIDCLSSHGVCASGINGLKAASHAVALGEHETAVSVGYEALSKIICAAAFENVDLSDTLEFDPSGTRPLLDREFLRYMLSDGAGAAVVTPTPHREHLSYRVEGFYHHSFAHEMPVCMSLGLAGPEARVNGTWNSGRNFGQAAKEGMMLLRQDVKLLDANILPRCTEALEAALDAGLLHGVDGRVDWCLPHVSSYYFYDGVCQSALDVLGLPKDHVWTNLESVGNVGSASPFLLLSGALDKDTGPGLKKGDVVVLAVPESGRFSFHFAALSVVDATG